MNEWKDWAEPTRLQRVAALMGYGLAAFLALGLVATGCLRETRVEREMREALRSELRSRPPRSARATIDADDVQPLVQRFYRARALRPAWTGPAGLTGDGRALVRVLEQS